MDPSIFSQALMYHAYQAASAGRTADEQTGTVYPHDILRQAYEGVLKEEDVVAGESSSLDTLD